MAVGETLVAAGGSVVAIGAEVGVAVGAATDAGGWGATVGAVVGWGRAVGAGAAQAARARSATSATDNRKRRGETNQPGVTWFMIPPLGLVLLRARERTTIYYATLGFPDSQTSRMGVLAVDPSQCPGRQGSHTHIMNRKRHAVYRSFGGFLLLPLPVNLPESSKCTCIQRDQLPNSGTITVVG